MPKGRILIVEDEPNILESLSFILKRAAFDVDMVSDGREALDVLRRGNCSMLILDIMLPGMSGFEVLKEVRGDPALARLPVLVLTARGQSKDKDAAEALGADAFITKPYSNLEVVERVRQFAAEAG